MKKNTALKCICHILLRYLKITLWSKSFQLWRVQWHLQMLTNTLRCYHNTSFHPTYSSYPGVLCHYLATYLHDHHYYYYWLIVCYSYLIILYFSHLLRSSDFCHWGSRFRYQPYDTYHVSVGVWEWLHYSRCPRCSLTLGSSVALYYM